MQSQTKRPRSVPCPCGAAQELRHLQDAVTALEAENRALRQRLAAEAPPELAPEWWSNQGDPEAALAAAVPHHVVPMLLRPVVAAALPVAAVAVRTVQDAAACVTKLFVPNGVGQEMGAAAFARLGSLPHLRALVVHTPYINAAGYAEVAKASGLEELQVRTALNDDAMQHVCRLSSLRVLLIEVPELSGAGMAHIHRLTNLAKLKIGSRLCRGETLDPATLGHIGALPNLQSLTIHRRQSVADDAGTTALLAWADGSTAPRLPQLTELDLMFCDATQAGVARIAACLPNLRSLSLSGTGASDAAAALLSQLVNLEELDLGSCSDVGPAAVQQIARLPRLRSLSFEAVTWLRPSHMTPMAQLRTLTSLNLARCQDVDAAALATVVRLWTLRTLRLDGCLRLQPADYGMLTSLPELRTLTVGNLGPDALLHVGTVAQLTSLRIVCNSLSAPGAAHIAKLNALEELSIENCNRLSGAVGAHVAKLARLRILGVKCCNPAPDFLARIAVLPALTAIDLRQCRSVTAAGIAHLAQSRSLRELALDVASVTAAEAASLLPSTVRCVDLTLRFSGHAKHLLIQ